MIMQIKYIKIKALFFCMVIMLAICACSSEGKSDTLIPKENGIENAPAVSSDENEDENEIMKKNLFYITKDNTTFTAVFEDNKSAEAFRELLQKGDITIDMNDYGGFEKVGSLGTSLPRCDADITTEPGDVILYQGNKITVYYDTNSWCFTRLGRIQNVSKNELVNTLGKGDVTLTFSLYASHTE